MDTTQEEKLSPESLKQIKYIHAHNTLLHFSNWDVRLVFPENKTELQVGIVLSYQQAKALSEALKTNMERIEDFAQTPQGKHLVEQLAGRTPPDRS
jgi:hypothetical protein